MADKVSMFANLRLKCAPMQRPEGDKRYWYSDAYGFSDDFGTPIADATNGPYGPPQMRTVSGDTGRYAGSLVGTLARIQGYDSTNTRWRRLAVNASGQIEAVITGTVTVTPTPLEFSSDAIDVDTSSTEVAETDATRRYIRFDLPAGAADVWVMPGGSPAVVGSGIKVTPTSPFTMEMNNLSTIAAWHAISTSGTVQLSVTQASE